MKGNLIQSSDTLTVAGGTVDVSGDYRMENENVDSTGNVSYSYTWTKGYGSDRLNAGGDEELDEHITSLCNDKGILINVVDVKDKCDFIFPSVVSRGKLEIGISSSGASPRITTLLAGEIDNILPDNIEEILDYLEKLRPYAKQKISNDVLRARFLSYMAELTYSRRNIPDDEELEKILNKFLNPIETI